MAGLFCDSFDGYAIGDILKKWTDTNGDANALNSTAGRHGSNGIALSTGSGPSNGYARITLAPGDATCIAGGAWQPNTVPATVDANESRSSIFTLWDAGIAQIWVRPNADSTISIMRGTSVLVTSTISFAIGTRYFLEFKITVNNSTGLAEVRMDGSVIATFSGNTRNTSNNSWNQVSFQHPVTQAASPNVTYWDDVYILDGTGSGVDPRDYLGDVRVDAQLSSTDGFYSQWTRSTGASNAANIDDTTQNGDTDYNSTPTLNNIDTFTFSAAPVTGADIFFTQMNVMTRKTDAGSAGVKGIYRIGGTDYPSASEGFVPVSYAYRRFLFQKNPATSAAFVSGDFPLDAGYKKTS